MKITKSNLPENSTLKKEYSFEFIDGYKGNFIDKNNEINIQSIGKLFFTTGPKWIDKLFKFRNMIVKLVGLKTANNISKRQLQLNNFKGEPGEQIGLFKVFQRTDNEIILGEDDKHLNFRVSLFLEQSGIEPYQKQLTISTLVKFNNKFGKIYFIPVKPFHKKIVPTMLKGIIKEINKSDRNFD